MERRISIIQMTDWLSEYKMYMCICAFKFLYLKMFIYSEMIS